MTWAQIHHPCQTPSMFQIPPNIGPYSIWQCDTCGRPWELQPDNTFIGLTKNFVKESELEAGNQEAEGTGKTSGVSGD